MIPVELQPEPPGFHENVRQRGRTWMKSHGVEPDAPPPDPAALPPYWRGSNRQLWDAYSGVCAYLAIYFEWCIGAASTDHFVAKSRNARDAERTIARLKLDSPEHNEMRAKRFARYVDGGDEQTLREWSPFVWQEARRQNLL